MLSRYKSLQAIGIYTTAGFLNKGIAFLFLPLLTAYLQPSDYGIVTLFGNVIMLLTPFIGLSVITSISTDYFKYDKGRFSVYFSSILILPLILSALLCLLFLFLGTTIANYLDVPVHYLYFLPLLVLSSIFFEILLTIIRNKNKPVHFAILTFVKTILELGISMFLIMAVHMGWKGRIAGWIITGVLIIAYTGYYFYKNGFITRRIDRSVFPDELKYSIPIIVNQFAIFAVLSSDKFFIAEYLSTTEVGIYGVACQFGFIAFAISGALIMSFNPYLYNALRDYSDQKKKEIRRRIGFFIGLMFFACISIGLATPVLYKFFINSKYHSGIQYVNWILLSYFFWFIYWLLLGFLYYYKAKRILLFISTLTMTLALVLNYLLIKNYGITGAIYSLNINCFIAMTGIVLLLKYKFKFI